ncbi:hypothetical protein pipiens_007207 [Culex pipiens pipiens]|uniref:Uncharacterized protein n=1 Tax=Culex pipiens pipiens TaxID=38569 RepID=A0ABD1DLT9_CULPP
MTKLFEDTSRSETGPLVGDGDTAWTKLLAADTPSPILVKTVVDGGGGTKPPKDVTVSIDPDSGKPIVTTPGDDAAGTNGRRRESIIGTFHRQLRMSLKAVSETPGPLTSRLCRRAAILDNSFLRALSHSPVKAAIEK